MVLLSVVVVGDTWVAVSLMVLIGAVAQVEVVLLSVVGVGAVPLSLVVAAVAVEEDLMYVAVSLLVLLDAVAQVVVLLLAVGEEVSLSTMQESKASSTWLLGGEHCARPGCDHAPSGDV